jgi:CelD/BcsL family acetyltransferase involved in cellulose biosynthesis
MKVVVIPIKELTESMKQSWLDIQASNPSFSGPCFHPELFVAVGKFCPDVYITVLHEENKIVGFLPFLKDQKSLVAKPIHFCDYQFIMSSKSRCWDIRRILRHSGRNVWEFGSLVGFENIKSSSRWFEIRNSPRVDLSGGFEQYQSFLNQRNISFKGLMRKEKSLEYDIGSIHYIPNCDNVEVLRRVFSWRNNRFGHSEFFSLWDAEILEYLYYLKKQSFSTVLSALYFREDLLAAVLCIRYQGKLYYLVPAFNPNFSKYSPGLLILYHLISKLNILQCSILDLGPGIGQYKWYFSNSTLPFMSGCIGSTPFSSVREHKYRLRKQIQSTKWLYLGLRSIMRVIRKMTDSA